jgi:hypothetical protein
LKFSDLVDPYALAHGYMIVNLMEPRLWTEAVSTPVGLTWAE